MDSEPDIQPGGFELVEGMELADDVEIDYDFWATEDGEDPNPMAIEYFERRLAKIAQLENNRIGRKNMWLAHHWPEHYGQRCVRIGKKHVCRRCLSLYPLGVVVAMLSAGGFNLWPLSIDPWPLWLLSLPATLAYCGEALGLFRYHARVQVVTTLVAALAFGHALGYEFRSRWSPEFWQPVCVFGLTWFLATLAGKLRQPVEQDRQRL